MMDRVEYTISARKFIFFYISAKNLYKIFIFHKDVAVS